MLQSQEPVVGGGQMDKMRKLLNSPLSRRRQAPPPPAYIGATLDELSRRENCPVPKLVTKVCSFIHENGECLLSKIEVLVVTIDAQWEGMGDVGSARYESALLPPCPTIRVLSYST